MGREDSPRRENPGRSPSLGNPSARLREIAIHEAGHAVLAWLTGRKIERVSMLTDAELAILRNHPNSEVPSGCIVLAPLPLGIDLENKQHRTLAEREALIALAGELAALKFLGRRRKSISRGDLEGLSFAAAHAVESEEKLEQYLDRIATKTTQYLDAYWAHVEALADALLRQRELSGNQVKDIMRIVERQRK